jgi:hypothetical protein
LAGGEPLLVGVDQSSATARYPMNRMHGKVEERAANSPRCFPATGIDRGGRAASNGGQRSSTPKDGAKSVKQIEKEKEEGLDNFQTATQSLYTSLRRRWRGGVDSLLGGGELGLAAAWVEGGSAIEIEVRRRTHGCYLRGARRAVQGKRRAGAASDSIIESTSVTSKGKKTTPISGPQTSAR